MTQDADRSRARLRAGMSAQAPRTGRRGRSPWWCRSRPAGRSIWSARVIAPRSPKLLGQQVIVENIGGAGGMTGAAAWQSRRPTATMFLFGNQGTHTFSQMLYKKPLYNRGHRLRAGGGGGRATPSSWSTRKDFPANTLANSSPMPRPTRRKMQYGSAGAGSATHVACVLLNATIGVDITHVPYRGTGPAMQDMIAGRIDYICDVISTALPLMQGRDR